MNLQWCSAVRRRLSAFHDGELPLHERAAVQEHLSGCEACAAEARSMREIGEALRIAAAVRLDEQEPNLAALPASVVSRFSAERSESIGGRLSRAFEDLHVVWVALGATGSAVACVALIVGLFQFGFSSRPDSLAAVIAAMATPGSNENPVSVDGLMYPPTFSDDGDSVPMAFSEEDLVLALSAVVTREGGVKAVELLQSGVEPADAESHVTRQTILDLMDAISRARLQPARYGNAPVAVKVVWYYAHLTVRGKLQPEVPAAGRVLSISYLADQFASLAA